LKIKNHRFGIIVKEIIAVYVTDKSIISKSKDDERDQE
jgi:hypothetical protein